MVAKGKAAKSASGASMSKYDVEVETRLKALEAQAHEKCESSVSDADLEKTVEKLIHFLKVQFPKQFKFYSD